MLETAQLLLPDLTLILIGFLLNRHVRWPADFWSGAERLVYYVLFPALLFISVARAPLELTTATRLIVAAYTALGIGLLLGLLALPALKPNQRDWASGFQCAFRFNSYVALAVASRMAGADGLAAMAIIVGCVVPLANMASVTALARHGGHNVAAEMLRNPLILSTAGGLLWNLASLPIPQIAVLTLERLGGGALALGLICVGAGVRLAALHQSRHLALWITLTKLIAVPAAGWAMAAALSLPPMQQQIVVLFGALPTASASFILAARMGGNAPMVAGLVSLSTLGSLVTMPIWLMLAR